MFFRISAGLVDCLLRGDQSVYGQNGKTGYPGRRPGAQNLLLQAQAKHAEGRLAEAAAFYQEFLRLRPDDHEAIEGLGIVLFQMGRIETASTLLAREY